MPFCIFDAHCDTISRILDNDENIIKNDGHLDSLRMKKSNNKFIQVFAAFSEDKTQIPIATFLIDKFSKQKRYSIINATGNSMAPTIDSGDKLVVEHWTGDQIQDNKIYVFCFNNEFFVKRLSKNLDEIIIKSDNSDYRTRTISGDTISELTLIGKIVDVIKAL